jgi:1,4-alpha-glucan branching enzyme
VQSLLASYGGLDHFSYLIDPQHRFLLIGIILLVMTAVFTLSGETLERYHGVVYRMEEPKRFWWDVVLYFLAGLFFIGLYVYQHSN